MRRRGIHFVGFTSMENIPFRAGQDAEARSFLTGYRGSWFRCKIREITKKNKELGHISEYYDFPLEKIQWTKLYQVPPYCIGDAKKRRREPMLRPHYPPIYNVKQIPHANEISEVIVIICDSWKVGDLVDWWNDDCYWSGRITQLFNDQEAQIELNPKPRGEGSSYRALLEDLRPSLNWSPEHGWTVPTREGGGHPCAHLIKPINQDVKAIAVTDRTIQETEAAERPAGSSATLSFPFPVSSNSAVSSDVKSKTATEGATVSKEREDDTEKSASQGRGDSSSRKTSRADADSRSSAGEQSVEVAENNLNCKKYRPSRVGALNSKRSDTVEAAILDLEEYVNKVKWLKRILKFGISSSENRRPQWKFGEPDAAS